MGADRLESQNPAGWNPGEYFFSSKADMSGTPELRQRMMNHLQEAQGLQLAYVGLVNGLFQALAAEPSSGEALAGRTATDPAYVARWCDAAYAFGMLDENQGQFTLSSVGQAFLPDASFSLMPLAVNAMLNSHMADRAAALMRSGERPGEEVLAENKTLLPWFGPMLEGSFAPLFDQQILNGVPVFSEMDRKGGLVVDLGCGNGWYLRQLARKMANIKGVGLDGFAENIHQAADLAKKEKLDSRLRFLKGDIHDFTLDEPADIIAMNRALHHVWDKKESVFAALRDHLAPGGAVVIWEPNWPANRAELRHPAKRGLALQNLIEHIQGNHLLRPDEISAGFESVGMIPQVYLFAEGREAVIVGRKKQTP